jgi:hypothetical protein
MCNIWTDENIRPYQPMLQRTIHYKHSVTRKASHTLRGESEATVHSNANLTNNRKLPRNEEITPMPKLRLYADILTK